MHIDHPSWCARAGCTAGQPGGEHRGESWSVTARGLGVSLWISQSTDAATPVVRMSASCPPPVWDADGAYAVADMFAAAARALEKIQDEG